MKRFYFFYASLLFFLGCGAGSNNPIPKVQLGKDTCAQCGMIISEARFASGYVDSEGKTVAFDDLGELFAAVKNERNGLPKIYVAVTEGLEWIPAQEARFARAPGFATPMGSGVIAFANDEHAASFAKLHGDVPIQSFREMAGHLSGQ